MKGLILLFRFMTRLPIGLDPKFDSDELGKGMRFFPVVGMVIGLILFLAFCLLGRIIYSPMVMAVILVIIEVVLTGGLHLDGLADTFDGIFSYRSKQKMLDIMKDSRLGTNGGLVLILYFFLKVALLVEGSSEFPAVMPIMVLISPVIARLNSVVNCGAAPYARATGMGKTFVDHTDGVAVGVATILTAAFVGGATYLFELPYTILIIIPIVMILGYLFAKLMTRKIGGITGDTLGAVVEISEIIVLLGIYILAR
ncbi:MAG: adenosylcobinamide-GDP ribazoletransferase [Fusobacterium sp.]|nr:adenosylcobinamide-GDP ribazoletransferase [Fusobacterium sp.]